MTYKRGKFFPIFITIIIIVIVIYLFANIEQTKVKCSKRTTDDLGITVVEELNTGLDGKKITELQLKRSIILPDKYLVDDTYLDYIQYTIEKSYAYLGKKKVKVSKVNDRVIVYMDLTDNETIILDNISFGITDDLTININSNTKSSDVVTLKVHDNYTQGELINHMKNNGYKCG